MKNLVNFAVVTLMSVLCAVVSSCGNDESFSDNRIAPVPEKQDTTPTPTTSDPKPSFIWDRCMEQNVTFYPETDSVLATNIWQVTENGEATFVDAVMRYKYEIDFTAPTRVVTSAQDTTVYAGGGLFKSDYSNYRRADKDSLWDVNSYIEGGYKTQYYTMSLKTSRMEGIDLRGGKENRYFNVSETPTIKSIWHEDIYEVESNDSIFNRETVHNVLLITLTGTKGNKWYVTREKVVIVDHFLKVREEEKKEETINADVWVDGLGRLVSLTRGIREDSRNPCDFSLFEGSTGYTIIIDTYSTDGKYLSTGTEFHSFDECPKSNDYDGVAYIKGHFYPGAITYDYSSKGTHDWDIVCYINKKVESQHIVGQDAVARGIKNFKENNSAYPWPYLTNTSTSKEVNGKKVITVNGKTSEGRAVMKHVVADSSLK